MRQRRISQLHMRQPSAHASAAPQSTPIHENVVKCENCAEIHNFEWWESEFYVFFRQL
jgi:hypothetical protein